MKLLVFRNYKPNCTISAFMLLRDDMQIITIGNILELPWKANQKQISCIPEGTYNIVPHKSPKFGHCLLVKDVPDRSNILIHAGNTTKDTKGCLLPGELASDKESVGSSRDKLTAIMRHIPKTGAKMIILDIDDVHTI